MLAIDYDIRCSWFQHKRREHYIIFSQYLFLFVYEDLKTSHIIVVMSVM